MLNLILNLKQALGIIPKLVYFTPLLLLSSCFQKEEKKNLTPEQKAQAKLVTKGRAVYMSNCTACHNIDPKLQGSMGPDVYGSSLELIRLRVMDAKYPEGYKPKRTTSLMLPMEELEKDIPSIHAFLNHQDN